MISKELQFHFRFFKRHISIRMYVKQKKKYVDKVNTTLVEKKLPQLEKAGRDRPS